MSPRTVLGNIPWILVLMFLTACGVSEPTNFYVLSYEESGSKAKELGARKEECPGINLVHVSFPEYLDRWEIMTRLGPNRLDLSELHHWAEPLKGNFVRILSANLNTRLCAEGAAVVSGRNVNADYKLRVKVLRLEPVKRERAVLLARWIVSRADSGTFLCSKRKAYQSSLEGEDHKAAVAAMSKTISLLSSDIAACLKQDSGKGADK